MTHWSESIVEILSSSSGDLKDLALMAKQDWRRLYRGQSLRGCDLRGQDLRGMDLTGCGVRDAKIDALTKLDPEFDPRTSEKPIKRAFLITSGLDQIVRNFAREFHYRQIGWAYRRLITEYSEYELHIGEHPFQVILDNPRCTNLVSKRNRLGRFRRQILTIDATIAQEIERIRLQYPNYDSFSLIVIIGLISIYYYEYGFPMRKEVNIDSVLERLFIL
jgi:hypothetical protein